MLRNGGEDSVECAVLVQPSYYLCGEGEYVYVYVYVYVSVQCSCDHLTTFVSRVSMYKCTYTHLIVLHTHTYIHTHMP